MDFNEATGWWLPEGEAHLQPWMLKMRQRAPGGRLGYQLHKYQMAVKYVKKYDVAVDVGAHVGLWSWPMSHDFKQLWAFEPMPEHQECWHKNMENRYNAKLYPYALGSNEKTVSIKTRTVGSSGDTNVDLVFDPNAATKVEMKMLDSYKFDVLDFMKIDCEGYELFVLQGAKDTLLRCKPCIIVEQKPETGMAQRYNIGTTEAVIYLMGLGAKKRTGIQGDYILSWD